MQDVWHKARCEDKTLHGIGQKKVFPNCGRDILNDGSLPLQWRVLRDFLNFNPLLRRLQDIRGGSKGTGFYPLTEGPALVGSHFRQASLNPSQGKGVRGLAGLLERDAREPSPRAPGMPAPGPDDEW